MWLNLKVLRRRREDSRGGRKGAIKKLGTSLIVVQWEATISQIRWSFAQRHYPGSLSSAVDAQVEDWIPPSQHVAEPVLQET